MDVFDQATELERLDRESALMRARAAIDRGGPEMIDGVAHATSWYDIGLQAQRHTDEFLQLRQRGRILLSQTIDDRG